MRSALQRLVHGAARATAVAQRRGGIDIGDGVLCFGRPLLAAAPGSRITVAADVRLVSRSRRTPLGINHPVVMRTLLPGAEISIGPGSGLSGGTICAAVSVSVGAGCVLGANVTVVDTDFHPLHGPGRSSAPIPTPRPDDRVVIGDNVFLGTGSIVLKGVSIGENSVVGAGSVVTSDCPANAIVAGNPARVIGSVRSTTARDE